MSESKDFQQRICKLIAVRLQVDNFPKGEAYELAESLVEMICEHFPEVSAAQELLSALKSITLSQDEIDCNIVPRPELYREARAAITAATGSEENRKRC